MTLLELREYVKARAGSTKLVDAEITQHINEAYREISGLFTNNLVKRDTTTLVTVAGRRLYSLNTDVRVLRRLYMIDADGKEKRLELVSEREVAVPYAEGEPANYYLAGTTLVNNILRTQVGLDPVPTSSYANLALVQEYEPYPPVLVYDVDTPVWVPEAWHHLIAHRALVLVAKSAGEWGTASAWREELLRGLDDLAWQQLGSGLGAEYPTPSTALPWTR